MEQNGPIICTSDWSVVKTFQADSYCLRHTVVPGLSPLTDVLVFPKKKKKKTILALITELPLGYKLMWTAPDEPIEQSKQKKKKLGLISEVPSRGHWACTSLSALQRSAFLPPPPLPFHLSAETSQCSESHEEINAPLLPASARAAEGSALPLQCDLQLLCSSVNGHTSLYLSWPLRLRAAWGCYGVKAEREWFIPVVPNVVCSNVAMQLDVTPKMFAPLIYGAVEVGWKKRLEEILIYRWCSLRLVYAHVPLDGSTVATYHGS